MIQKSYEKDDPIFYLVPTPIGNLKDITYRAVEVLTNVDVILAEDTRVTSQLLSLLNIKNKVLACHKFNENKMVKKVLEYLENGKSIALVTDRGTPLISDPGSVVVNEAIKNNYTVSALPGASALLPALNMSNIDSDKFLFYGFLNSKSNQARKELETLKDIKFTIVLYEAPHRLSITLQNILEIMGNRRISISREISKKHEEVFRGFVEEATQIYKEVKGEIVIVIDKVTETENELYDFDYLMSQVNWLISIGISTNIAIKEISKKHNISKNELYEIYQRRSK